MPEAGMEGRSVVITGGASGIGRGTAHLLARQRAKLVLLDHAAEQLDAAVSGLRDLGADATGFVLDVSDERAVEDAATRVAATAGPPFGLITSAGISVATKAEMLTADEWNRVMAVNALGTFLCCRAFGKQMIAAQEGAIVCLGSVDGLGGHAGRAAYVSSKFAVHGLVRTLAIEWGRFNVRVNAIAPTYVDTPLVRRGTPEGFLHEIVDRTPMARIAFDEDVAGAILFLLSPSARFMTGTVLPVDGGITAGHFTRRSGADFSSKRLLDAGIYEE